MADKAIPRPERREAFYRDLERENLGPLWESLHRMVPTEPAPRGRPIGWDYDNVIRRRLMQAGELISARDAGRRVLMLQNPGFAPQVQATGGLYAGVQMILPGEVAPAHRHTQAAIRFILEGQGAYTAVEGERTLMSPGDFVTTASWTWHDHGNGSDGPMVWLDVLDLPIMAALGATFLEASNAEEHPVTRPVGDSADRYGRNLFPVDWKPSGPSSPIFNYPYARTREVLAIMARNGEPDPCHGHKMRYVNPATGGHVMPTMGAFAQLLPAGMATAPYRSTDGGVHVVTEGEGETRFADGSVIRWKPRDIFVVPGWALHTHHPRTEAVLFSVSDRPVHEALAVWREERRSR